MLRAGGEWPAGRGPGVRPRCCGGPFSGYVPAAPPGLSVPQLLSDLLQETAVGVCKVPLVLRLTGRREASATAAQDAGAAVRDPRLNTGPGPTRPSTIDQP